MNEGLVRKLEEIHQNRVTVEQAGSQSVRQYVTTISTQARKELTTLRDMIDETNEAINREEETLIEAINEFTSKAVSAVEVKKIAADAIKDLQAKFKPPFQSTVTHIDRNRQE